MIKQMDTREYTASNAHEKPEGHPWPEAPGWWLWAWESGDSGRWVELLAEHLQLGRSLSADIRFEHASVSRRHAILRYDSSLGWTIQSDGANNALLVNGVEVEYRKLLSGDRLDFGHARAWILYSGSTEEDGS
jgi:hypothetical protein